MHVLCRCALGHIIDRSMALVEYLRERGPKTVHNMDTLLLRESMDVIGAPPWTVSSPVLVVTHHDMLKPSQLRGVTSACLLA